MSKKADALFSVSGKVVAITGAAGVIYGTIAKGLAAHGAKVALLDLLGDKAEEIAHEVRKGVMRSHRGGVKVAMGTDAGTPFNRHGANAQEIIHLVEAGFSPMEAIVAATRTGSECLGLEKQIGTLEPGKLADLIVVEGDPLKEVNVLGDKANILLVLKGGMVEVNRGV